LVAQTAKPLTSDPELDLLAELPAAPFALAVVATANKVRMRAGT